MTTKQLRADLEKALTVARDIAADAEKAGRDFTDEERATITKAVEDANGIKAKLVKAGEDDELRQSIKALGEGIGLADDDADADEKPARKGGAPTPAGKTVGARFVDSAEYKAMMAPFPGGRIGDKSHVSSSPVAYKALLTGDSATSAGALFTNDFRGVLDSGLYARPLTIRDVITIGQTDGDTIEYVREGTFTNNAAPVKEAVTAAAIGSADASTTVDSTEAGVKPESSMAFTRVTTNVITIAHWMPATKRALSDASQLRTIIDNFLRYGLEEELEDQIVNGDGTGENFTGIANVSGVQAQAWDTDILTTTRKARTKVRTVGRAVASAYVLNPADWETIDLTQDNEARYFFGGPARLGVPTLWGLPVVECEAVAAGTGYVADFRKAVLWDREQAAITVTDSHADFFIRNLVAILAEMRAAFGILRPTAFVEMDLTA